MKKILLVTVTALLFSPVIAQLTISDANAEPRAVTTFNAIKVSHAFDVYLVQGTEEGLAVSAADKKYLSYIKTESKDGVLKVWYDGGSLRNSNTGKMKLKVYISFSDISKLEVSGACDVYVKSVIKLDNLKLKLSGASDIREGTWHIGKLGVDMSGASDIVMRGTVGQLDINASGASDFSGYGLQVDYGNFNVSGVSDIKITVNKEFSAQASGNSDIKYKGQGVIRSVKTSGSSSITKRS